MLGRRNLLSACTSVLCCRVAVLLGLCRCCSGRRIDPVCIVWRVERLLWKFHILGIRLAGKSKLGIGRRSFRLLIEDTHVLLAFAQRVSQQGCRIRDGLRDDTLIGLRPVTCLIESAFSSCKGVAQFYHSCWMWCSVRTWLSQHAH